jgi:hypothetical protein
MGRKEKKYKPVVEETQAEEPQAALQNRVTITTLEALEESDREHTRNMTHEQRMEYLCKLISITYGDDLSQYEKEFYNGIIRINMPE